MMPQGQQQVTPLDANARVAQSEATARTFASSSLPPSPIVPTAGGVAREASGPAKRGGRAGVVAGIVAGVVALAVGGALVMRSHGAVPAAGIASEPAGPARPATPPIVTQPPPVETAVLAPTAAPSDAPKPSATPTAQVTVGPAPAPKPAPHPASPGPALPNQLGDLRLH
jgi:hypothetical protein